MGNPVVITDALTHTTTTVYDAQYHLYPVQIGNANNQTTTMTYDMALGVVTQISDPNSAVTTYAYDTFGRLLRVARPYDSDALPTIEYQYTDAYAANGLQGLRITQRLREISGDPNAVRVIHAFYDGLGREVQTRAEASDGSQQAVTNIVYDARGQVQSSYVPTFENSNPDFVRPTGWNTRPRTQTQYDALGRTIVITNTDTTVMRTAYRGRSTGVLDANGHQRISAVDAYGRLAAVSEYTNTLASVNFTTPAYANTTYRYDALNNLTRVTDAVSNTTIITYNALSQKTAMSDPDMGVWQYAYDAAGNLTRQTDARGQRVCFTYDALNRLTGKHYRGDDNCPTINPTLNVTYTYDLGVYGIGRRTSMSDETGSTTWNYDARGRLLVDSRAIPGVRAFGLGYAYDAMDRITAITYPNGEVVTQTYNAASQVIGVTGANVYASGLAYNAQGQIQQMNLGNALVTQYAYDPLNFRLRSLQTGSLLNFQYGYDAVGNVTRITDTVNSAQFQTFSYDALDRLTNAATNASGNGQYSESYSYNSIGNILNKGGSTYQYADPLHKHAVTTAGSNSYSYDANGNMLSRNESGVVYTQQWDAENRLKVVTNTLTREVTKFVYDGDGARVLQIYSGTYTSTTIYLGTPAEITILGAPLPPPTVTVTIPPTMTYRTYLPLVLGGQAAPPRTQPLANETWKMYYAVGNQVVAMRVLTSTGSTLYYLRSDHLGSTSMIMDASGTKMGEMRYKPYGEIRYTWGISPTNIGYTGQRLDATGLMFYQARYYDGVIGRFVSADTIVSSPADPQQLNRCAYGLNNPVKYTDPTGHRPACGIDSVKCEREFPPGRFLFSQSYGYFDQAHFPAGNQADVIRWVRQASTNGGGQVEIGQSTQFDFYYKRTYMISANVDDPTGVALGIYEDWSVAFEAWEGQFPFSIFTTSSFSMEDLPSHYLGFVAASRGFSTGNMAPFFEHYASALGPVEPTTQGPPQVPEMKSLCIGRLGCAGQSARAMREIKNHQFTPLVQDANGRWRNVPWPAELTITPVGSGPNTWQFVSENHNNNPGYWIQAALKHIGIGK